MFKPFCKLHVLRLSYFHGIIVLIILLSVLSLVKINSLFELENLPRSRQMMKVNPPRLEFNTAAELSTALKATEDQELRIGLLSETVQSQIHAIESQSNCSGPSLKCGHYKEDCGFGCQVHHRVACLMLSYVLNMPLIHDEDEGWSFSQKWSDMFQPLGSNCLSGPNTIKWSWNSRENLYISPLVDGISVDETLAGLIEKEVRRPFEWFVGQFMKYSLKLNPKTAEDVQRDMNAIQFEHPIVGLHIRRTDKIDEDPDSHHEIGEYMQIAGDYFKTIMHLHEDYRYNNGAKRIFIASDDPNVITEASQKYEEWAVIGFTSKETLADPLSRKNALYDIVRDLFILSNCDYVICGFSSNVCRLLLEIFSFKSANGYSSVRSLDREFSYQLALHKIPLTLLKRI